MISIDSFFEVERSHFFNVRGEEFDLYKKDGTKVENAKAGDFWANFEARCGVMLSQIRVSTAADHPGLWVARIDIVQQRRAKDGQVGSSN